MTSGDRAVLALFVIATFALALTAIADGTVVPLVLFVAGFVGVRAGARALVPLENRTSVVLLVTVAFLVRCAAAGVLYVRSLLIGQKGFFSGDDQTYAAAAWHIVRYLRGDPELPFVPPFWGGEYYLHGTFTFIEAAIFTLFGPHIVPMLILNAALGSATVLLVSEIARQLFGSRASIAAGLACAVYPSLILWSAINLRDTMVVFLIVLSIFAVHRIPGRSAAAWLFLAYCAVWAQEGLRRYIMVGLALVIPFAVALHPHVEGFRRRLAAVVGAIALSVTILSVSGSGAFLTAPLDLLQRLEAVRSAMSIGRTAFVPLETPATSVPTTVPTTRPTTVPTSVPTQVAETGPAGARIVVETSRPTTVPTSVPTSIPTTRPITVPVRTATPDAVTRSPEKVVGSRALEHLPRGIFYTLFAPFPWAATRPADALAIPEMLFWYLLLGLAARTIWSERERWTSFVPEGAFVLGMFLVFALAEGNVGTLFRHRAMVIPLVIVLASPGLAELGGRALSSVASRRRARP